jgi:hypothetical protein
VEDVRCTAAYTLKRDRVEEVHDVLRPDREL